MARDPLADAAELFRSGRALEAATVLERACARNPGNTHAWFLLGACRHALKAFDAALAAFDRAVLLDPSNIQAAQAAIAVSCDARRPAEALVRCKELLSRHPGDAQLHFNTGAVCEALDDRDGALQHYDRALALDAGHALARLDLGLALAASGRLGDAREELKQAVLSDAAAVRRRVEAWLAESGVSEPVDTNGVLQPEDIFLTMAWEPLERCDWSGWGELVDRCREMLGSTQSDSLQSPALAFKLLHLPLVGWLQKTLADRIAGGILRSTSALSRPQCARRARGKQIRIGYMSTDFGRHPVGYLTRSIYAL